MNILVTGGAGYIGSHAVKELLASGHATVTFDDLSQGRREAVTGGVFVEGDITDRGALKRCFREHAIDAVMHFAGKIAVGESVRDPLIYYHVNVTGSLALLEVMLEFGVRRLVFSSSAAVYGEPREEAITEDHPLAPASPYGRGKAFVESILADADAAFGLRYASLRYFNAAGADPGGKLGEAHDPETHLVPLVLRAALCEQDTSARVDIFGTDYPTPDGTCIRDYIHVTDLARAHVLAVEKLAAGAPSAVYNLGNGKGYSVREVIDTARRVTGVAIRENAAARRPGDVAVLVASSRKAVRELGWKPGFDRLEDIVATAWQWHQSRGM